PPSSRFPARARRPGDWLRSHDSRPATLSPPRAKLTPHADAGSTRRPARSARPRLLAPIPDRFLPYSSSASRASIAAVETHAAVRHHLNDVVTDHTVRDAEARSDLLDAQIVHAVENEGLAMALGQLVEILAHELHLLPAHRQLLRSRLLGLLVPQRELRLRVSTSRAMAEAIDGKVGGGLEQISPEKAHGIWLIEPQQPRISFLGHLSRVLFRT